MNEHQSFKEKERELDRMPPESMDELAYFWADDYIGYHREQKDVADRKEIADDFIAAEIRRAKAEAVREFGESLGVNVGDEDDEWWRGYRQGQREALHKASDWAKRLDAA